MNKSKNILNITSEGTLTLTYETYQATEAKNPDFTPWREKNSPSICIS